jgi:hypothetical protein
MMDEFGSDTALARGLHQVVQPKLAECGWTTGGDDTTLFDYILLMLANDKNENQVASELSNDLLDLGPENVETQQFSRWLFEQIDILRRQINGTNAGGDAPIVNTTENVTEAASSDAPANTQDTDMDGATDPSTGTMYVATPFFCSPPSAISDGHRDSARGLPIPPIESSFRERSPASWKLSKYTNQHNLTKSRPTGPKAMRNGSGGKSARGGRMLTQMNKNMGRTEDSTLHRVRGSQGAGRINSHSREPPKGPRTASQVGRGLDALAGGRGMNNMNMVPGGMNGMNGAPNMGAMPGMPMPGMGQPGMQPMLNPSQQMALMQMYEQQANMMQQLFAGQIPQPMVNPSFQHTRGGRGGKKFSGGDRGTGPAAHKHNLPPSTKFPKKEGQDETMTDGPAAETGDAMEAEKPRLDESTTMCHFDVRCSKADCPFVHSSPVATRSSVIDMNTECSFGASCKNFKCAGKHPSPAQRQKFQSEQECVFWPNCRDQSTCPFAHPAAPPCRNGADCTVPGCTFHHSKTVCKFNPCTKANCHFKHAEGQKKNAVKSNVWVAPGNKEEGDHVSERKFIDESKEEELLLPSKNAEMTEAAL